jgi:antitoxin VapB
MAVLIRDPETDRLIRELAQRTGESITEAVHRAAAERLERLQPRPRRVDRERLRRVIDEINALPRVNERLTDDEIIGYNDEGHFD